MQILIADDSCLSRTTLKDALTELNHQVIEATNGEEALDFFKKMHPDLVILDVVMEGMSGFECASKIREVNEEDWIPIIFLSSSLDDEYIAKGIDAGGDDYITKPFSQIVLSAKIRAMERIADMRRELIDATEKLNLLSTTDFLTGLYNRLEFSKRLEAYFSTADRYQRKFALLYIDIDYFKNINDVFGHHVGDLLLKEVAQRLTTCLRKHDFIARLGGDEFAVISEPHNSKESVEKLVKRIAQTSALPFKLENKTINITYSIGVAYYPQAGTEPITFLANADRAMYEVKKSGRNNYYFYGRSASI